MANNNKYHVISRNNDSWVVKREGASKAAGIYSTKAIATKASTKFLEQKNDVIIHNSDGTISQWRKAKK